MTFRRKFGVLGLLLACAFAFAARVVWWEPSSLVSHRYDLRIPAWPQPLDGLRVAVLADLHVGSPFNGLENLRRVVARTNELEPDLTLLAGDFVISGVLFGSYVHPKDFAPELAELNAPLGVWAVLGNHDRARRGAQRVFDALESAGIPTLEDRSVRLERGERAFWLAGISDWLLAPHDVERALSGVDDDRPVLAFTHNPDVFTQTPDRIALLIAGHTHGGQVKIPLIGRPVIPSDFGGRFAIGHIVEQGRRLFVSSGIGTSILPVRFLTPPEISLLVLRSGEAP